MAFLEVPDLGIGIFLSTLKSLYTVFGSLLTLQEFFNSFLLEKRYVFFARLISPCVLHRKRITILGVNVNPEIPSLIFSYCLSLVSFWTLRCQSMFF